MSKKEQIIEKPTDVLKSHYVLEFFDLKEDNRYSETDLEIEIINKLEYFIIELRKGFLFEDIASLHEKNTNSAVNEKTAKISALLENLQRENAKLNSELSNKGPNYSLMIIMVILALVVGFIIAKII